MPRYGLPLHELPHRVGDAVDVAERNLGSTILLRHDQPVAALVSMQDLDRADPPDPGLGGADPLLSLCGACRLDWFVEQVLTVYGAQRHDQPRPPAPEPSSREPSSLSQAIEPAPRTTFEAPLPPRPRPR